ncbi:hypothetical protein FUAX_08920 [Fulvitalea axinellae]|uniref:Uncharacterized protein n=1 Tax=Fulvitalea axinellae TaxID=1182444 RepID=A0AAU9D890_9BACT|nr:hypothetical protein FUAX_08920 [Fulvitalea axinellae]
MIFNTGVYFILVPEIISKRNFLVIDFIFRRPIVYEYKGNRYGSGSVKNSGYIFGSHTPHPQYLKMIFFEVFIQTQIVSLGITVP